MAQNGEIGNELPDRRTHPRQAVRSLTYVELAEGNGGVALNISEGGMAVRSIMSLMSDDLPSVRIRPPHCEKGITVNARVVWSTDLGTLVGVKFIDLSVENTKLILEFALQESSGLSEGRPKSHEKNHPVTLGQSKSFIPVSRAHRWSSRHQDMARDVVSRVPRSSLKRDSLLNRWPWAVGTAAVLTALFLGIFNLGRLSSSALHTTRINAATGSRLGLKLDRRGSDWQISWDPNAPPIQKATKGQLFITDGELHKTVDLNTSDLHGGVLIYSASASDVIWKLQVMEDTSQFVSESVRTVGAPAVRFVLPSVQVKGQSTGNKRDVLEQHVGHNPSRPLTPPKVPESGFPAKQLDTSLSGQVAVPPHQERFQEAQILVRGSPNYPASAREDGISGTVELRFKIGSNGAVHDISVIRGPNILAQAAIEAVADRKYKPARIAGVPTETQASATFDFKLN